MGSEETDDLYDRLYRYHNYIKYIVAICMKQIYEKIYIEPHSTYIMLDKLSFFLGGLCVNSVPWTSEFNTGRILPLPSFFFQGRSDIHSTNGDLFFFRIPNHEPFC